MSDKSGIGSLILNILIVLAVALVTFQAASESSQNPGPTPLWNPRSQEGTPAPSSLSPAKLGEKGAEDGLQKTPPSASLDQEWGLPQISGALLAYLSSLDGKLTPEEVKKIALDVGVSWKGQTEDFLGPLAEKIRAGQGQEIVTKALGDLGKSTYDTKVKVVAWVADWLRTQGWSWDEIQKATGHWTQDILKVDSVDFWGALKKN